MDQKMLDIITEISDGFEYDKLILNIPKIESISQLRDGSFVSSFLNEMNKFRHAKPDEPYSDIASILEIASNKNPHQNFEYICEQFHNKVLEAKAYDVIIDKPLLKELEKYKQKCSELENKLKNAENKIDGLNEQIGRLKEARDIYNRDLPNKDSFQSDVSND